MKYFREEISIYTLLENYPYLIDTFKQHGLGKFENPEVLEKLGPLLKLKTALKSLSINEKNFIDLLNKRIEEHRENNRINLNDDPERQKELTMLTLLPCGMKMPFNRAFDEFISNYNKDHDKRFTYMVEGNMNHELSYYPYIDSVTSIEELPDIIISSDVNSFYHNEFKSKFLSKDYFIDLTDSPINSDFSNIGYSHPVGDFTMLSANLLVIVSVNDISKELPPVRSWGDLLKKEFHNKVVMRGQKEFFCNGVLLPIYQLYGMDGLKQLASSIVTGLHPSQMVKMIDSRKNDIPPYYIMPHFFAMKIKCKERVTITIPEEGAIVSPVQMLVKRSAYDSIKDITDFLCGKNFGQISADAYFPSTNSLVKNSMNGVDKLLWPGWDFFNGKDIGQLKGEIGETFKEEFRNTGGKV